MHSSVTQIGWKSVKQFLCAFASCQGGRMFVEVQLLGFSATCICVSIQDQHLFRAVL